MEFRDLKKQYRILQTEIDAGMGRVLENTDFIQGKEVRELETLLAGYVGVRHCITCANGTDALQLALMAWKIGPGDVVFVPDFTFFSSGEVVPLTGAVPVFVDVEPDTYNIDVNCLKRAVSKVLEEGKLKPKVILAVNLFGQPARHDAIREVAEQYGLLVLEDAAQGFGGAIGEKRACPFGDIGTTSFFPAKPLGCYGDGGAIFTDDDDWAERLRSLRVHGKGTTKYDNIRIGMNSRLDTIQAAVLLAKFSAFAKVELEFTDAIAKRYTEKLQDIVGTPFIVEGYFSSWAQYTIRLRNEGERDGLQKYLKERDIPSMVYYQKPMHEQKAFCGMRYEDWEFTNSIALSRTVLSLPFHPYMDEEEVDNVITNIEKFMEQG